MVHIIKEDILSELIDLIKTQKRFLGETESQDLKNRYEGRIEGLIHAFNFVAVNGEITPETVILCEIKDKLLKEV